jgi:hypothetical protein
VSPFAFKVLIETGSKTKLGLAARTADQMPPRLYFKGIARQGGRRSFTQDIALLKTE